MRILQTVLLSLLLLLLVAGLVYAESPGPEPVASSPLNSANKYVSPTGSGFSCSFTAPCSIFTARAQAAPGDFHFLRGGVYNIPTAGTSIDFTASGTANARITWESYPGETAIWDGGALPEGTAKFIRVPGNYNTFRKIEIRNMPSQGFYMTGNNNIVEGMNIHDNKISGFHITDGGIPGNGSFNIFQNNIVKDNSDVNTSGGGNADGVSLSSGADNQILHNWVEHNSDDGIDTWKTQRTIVKWNISSRNGIGTGNGMGYKCGGAPPNDTQLCEHNISFSNRTAGFDTNSGKNTTMRFNTSWNNANVGFIACTGAANCTTLPPNNTVVTDNIAVANNAPFTGTGVFTNNSWQRGGTLTFMSTTPGDPNFLRPTIGGGFEDIGAYATSGQTFYMSPSGDDARSCATATNINTPKRTIGSTSGSGGAGCLND